MNQICRPGWYTVSRCLSVCMKANMCRVCLSLTLTLTLTHRHTHRDTHTHSDTHRHTQTQREIFGAAEHVCESRDRGQCAGTKVTDSALGNSTHTHTHTHTHTDT